MTAFEEALQAGRLTRDQALALYDSLAPASIDFMLGTWQGSEFPTGHPMDGLLEASGWYGKQFVDADQVHPLLFHTGEGNGFFIADPVKLPAGPNAPRPAEVRAEVETAAPKARLRMTEFRGQLCATMIYDERPIHDVFRRVDANTVLGAMDMRGLPPYFFVLRRVQPTP